MPASPVRLTDEQMRHFIAHGCLVLQTDFSPEFHAAMNARITDVMRDEGNPGNNILPRVPEIQEVFHSPVITGAVSSVLGDDYITQPHRHCHYTEPGRKVQSWHKDSYWGYARIRNHHPWWAMIFYYPQEVTPEMGPSGLLPGTHYYDRRPADETEEPLYMEGPEGTFALIHYDLWHRGGANASGRNRAMLKFQFTRMSRPQAPDWNNEESDWVELNGQGPAHTHNALWADQWNWLSGRPNSLADSDRDPDVELEELREKVQGLYEPDGMGAAYDLAAAGDAGLAALQELLTGSNQRASRRAGYGMSAAGAQALPMLAEACSHESDVVRRYAVFGLGEHGPKAAEYSDLAAGLLQDESTWVRRTAVETLSLLQHAESAVPALDRALQDESDQVRFGAALSLGRFGEAAAPAMEGLCAALKDENRYVRGFSVETLRQIGTPEALQAACDHLMESRWCYSTTPDSTF